MSVLVKNRNVILLVLVLLGTSEACPTMCVCKWKSGKQTVECDEKGLLFIPEGMDPGTQVLDFSGNNLQILHKEKFLEMDLINLQRIYLSRCRISSIEDRTFKGLTNLVELDLSGNLLETVPTATFIDCPSLMRLTLSYNPIKIINRESFTFLSFLNTLEISNCEISNVEENAFQGLHSLEWLRLDGNRLTTIKGSKVLPESLKGIDLQGNLWNCDCNMLDLHEWLTHFNIPLTVQPACIEPPRLKDRVIKSININDLACLPDVNPTNFFVELDEGKNMSLLCHVSSIPEAKVTWLFHGQVLQNDTIIAPGMRLLYYVEEGHEEKHSELFLYNTNAEDNGTFICSAENPAGTSQSNFTIRIIVKEEPIIIVVAFPFEYFLAVLAAVVALIFILIISVIVSIVRCRQNRRRQQKREKTKEVALQYQQNSGKCAVIREDANPLSSYVLKQNDCIIQQQEVGLYSAHPSEELLRAMSPVAVANQVRSPSSLRRYQLEQNPDLINDTESVGRRREGDGEDEPSCNAIESTIVHAGLVQLPINCPRTNRKLYSVNSWDPGYAVETDGYPMDYGLPKLHTPQANENYYRTLPYNRVCRRQSAANPLGRYSREAEFLSRTAQPAPYEHYCQDVRYTADGYPARAIDPPPAILVPSPPEDYKCDANNAPVSLPCCSVATPIPWPICVSSNVHVINANLDCKQLATNISKRCVSAQTDNNECEKSTTIATTITTTTTTTPPVQVTTDINEKTSSPKDEIANDVLTESPDEGYEGEPTVV